MLQHTSHPVSALIVLAAFICSVFADRVYWVLPTGTVQVPSGCPVDLGYRVQYSDLAMLGWVQVQVLNADDSVAIDNLTQSTREDWDESNVRAKNFTWTVPSTMTAGDYTLRAFGNASYPCSEKGRRTFCTLELQDHKLIQIIPPTSDSCPSSLVPNAPTVIPPSTPTGEAKSSAQASDNNPLDLPLSLHVKVDTEALNPLGAINDSPPDVSTHQDSIVATTGPVEAPLSDSASKGNDEAQSLHQSSESPSLQPSLREPVTQHDRISRAASPMASESRARTVDSRTEWKKGLVLTTVSLLFLTFTAQ